MQEVSQRLRDKDNELISTRRELELPRIETDDMKNQRDNYLRLVTILRGDDPDAASVDKVSSKQSVVSRRGHRTAAPFSIGPNGSLHVPIAPSSVTGSLPTIFSSARQQQSMSALKVFLRTIPFKTCHKLIIVATALLVLYTALSIVYSKEGTDLGEGFALGSYSVTATALVATAVAAFHYPNCHCWKSKKPEERVRMRDRTT